MDTRRGDLKDLRVLRTHPGKKQDHQHQLFYNNKFICRFGGSIPPTSWVFVEAIRDHIKSKPPT